MTEPSTNYRFRWLPRFRLRTLLILMCVVGAGLGLGGNFWRHLQMQRRAISQVEGAGGRIIFAHNLAHYVADDEPIEYRKTSFLELPSGLLERTRHFPTGDVVECEKPPGPAIARWFLGDNAFATVDGVSFNWESINGDLDPIVLQAFPKMRTLHLAEDQVNEEWLREAAQLPDLRSLSLASDRLSSKSTQLAVLSESQKLEALHLSGKWLSDGTFREIGQLSQLKSLSIALCPQLSSNILQDVKKLKGLRSLWIAKAHSFDDEGTADLVALAELRRLSLLDTSIGERALKAIGKLKNLEYLDLSFTNIGDDEVKQHLAGLRRLQHLSFWRTNVGDDCVASLVNLRELRILSLGQTKVPPASLKIISGLKELQLLNLDGLHLESTETELQHLRSLTKLRRLRIGSIHPKALRDLQKSLPGCEITAVDDTGSHILPAYADE